MLQEPYLLMEGFKKSVVHKGSECYLVLGPTGIIWGVRHVQYREI